VQDAIGLIEPNAIQGSPRQHDMGSLQEWDRYVR
jgi:hypothetical protein